MHGKGGRAIESNPDRKSLRDHHPVEVAADDGKTGAVFIGRLHARAQAVARTVEPFVNEGMSFTPKRSVIVEAVLRDFERARDRYHEALRMADRLGGGRGRTPHRTCVV